MSPVTKFARSGKLNIAYQVVGDGPIDLVYPTVEERMDDLRAVMDAVGSERAACPKGQHVRALRGCASGAYVRAADGGHVCQAHLERRLSMGADAEKGIRFSDRGTHVLKGVPGSWQLHAAA